MPTIQPSAKRPALNWRTVWLLASLFALACGWAVFHRPLNYALSEFLLLRSNAPRDEVFQELAQQSKRPVEFLTRCWNTGKITHRELVASFLKDKAQANPPWYARAEPLLVAGAVDPDQSVRELALAALEASRNRRLFACARAQLKDVDPLVRLLGVEYLHNADPRLAVPAVMQLLDDPDPRVVTAAEAALRRWSGADFGIRQSMAIRVEGQPDETKTANHEAIRRGIEQRKQWWRLHAAEYASTRELPTLPARMDTRAAPTPHFALKDLQGRTVRLTDFRGKVVLLNFWASWCSACMAEIPDLIALQKKMGEQITIIGVALDGVPEEHSHESESGQSEAPARSVKAVRAKVSRAVKTFGINYPVLLDPTSAVGSRFNGGELPTTVILDQEGRVRRRFIGERNLEVFTAMVADASGAPSGKK